MCLEDIGGMAFPEHLASFLCNIVREVPAVTITVHAHLWILLGPRPAGVPQRRRSPLESNA